jgi:cytochrome c-type biogenesis protein CcmF
MIGTILQYGALLGGLAATALLWYAVVDERYRNYGAYSLGVATLLSGIALFHLASQFAVTDYTNGYVWNHTADYLSLLYRVTGVYAGVDGSLLLWATMISVVAYWTVRSDSDAPGRPVVHALVATVATIFFAYAITRTPFTSLSIAGRGVTFGPMGLNPLLKSPYMVIHPPITFAGYATTVVPFAIGITHLITQITRGDDVFSAWVGPVTRWLRLSWWFLTASVALGALWSYTTLGWGGLWAWDPVETAVLVTWLFVTATLHVVSNYRTRGRNPILAPALTALTFPSALFARVMTQSGTSELHSFASGSPTVLTALLVVSTAAAVLPAAYLWLSIEPEPTEKGQLITHNRLLVSGVLVLGLLTFVSFWGLIFPMLQTALGQQTAGISVDFYNLWSFPLAVLALLLIGLYNDYDVRGPAAYRLLGLVTVSTIVAAVLPLPDWQINPAVPGGYYGVVGKLAIASLFPPAAYAIGASITRIAVRWPKIADTGRRRTELGVGLVHVAIALLILSAPMTYMFATSGSGLVPAVSSGHGNGVTLGDSPYTVTVENYSSGHIESELALDEREYDQITRQIEDSSTRASELPASATGNQIVYGKITDLRRDEQTAYAELDNASVWVGIGPVRDNTSVDDLLSTYEHTPVYAQGTVNHTATNGTLVVTDGMFVGTDPTSALVPDDRATDRDVTVTVRLANETIATGTTGVDYHLAYGAVGQPHIEYGILSETYVAAQNVQFASGMPIISMTVKQVPMMNVVRLSVLLLLVGGALLISVDPEDDGG